MSLTKRTVVCVLKSGGDFTPLHALNLREQALEHNPDVEFICLTDMFEKEWTRPLKNRWEGWWSKIEVFSREYVGAVIYLDLDTALFGSLTPLFEAIEDRPASMFMRRPTRKKEQWASGVMGFFEQRKEIYETFLRDPMRWMRLLKWDQRFISTQLRCEWVGAVQDHLSGMYSYKHHCRLSLPDDARVVCFHGKPRPHEVGKPYWRF